MHFLFCAGRVIGRMPEGVTHALFERFPSKETLEQYMEHPSLIKVEDELIYPYSKVRNLCFAMSFMN